MVVTRQLFKLTTLTPKYFAVSGTIYAGRKTNERKASRAERVLAFLRFFQIGIITPRYELASPALSRLYLGFRERVGHVN